MKARPALGSTKRPLSAIFLGSSPSTTHSSTLPDLPDPPSPVVSDESDTGSGLPSPPATNSTGSSDIGRAMSRLAQEGLHPEEEEEEEEDGGDDTMRLQRVRKESTLERVKNLTQRNRQVLDKLASISAGSRHSTPLPSTNGHSTSDVSSSTASSSHQRRARAMTTSSFSGSETEREREPTYDESSTPPSTLGRRQRLVSAPASPAKLPLRTPSKRISVAEFSPQRDLIGAALAAVATSRRSPTPGSSGRKLRQPLPREFTTTTDSQPPRPSTSTSTSNRGSSSPNVLTNRASPVITNGVVFNSPTSPRAAAGRYQARASTVREAARRHQTRWLSEDLGRESGEQDATEGLRPATMTIRRESPGGLDDVFRSRPPTRSSATPDRNIQPTSDHGRLLLEAVAVFDQQAQAPDLTRAVQTIVQNANTLNEILRVGTARALSAQIDVEVADNPPAAAEVWRLVGSEYRETLRLSDELVRNTTSFLLNAGLVLRNQRRDEQDGLVRRSLDESSIRRNGAGDFRTVSSLANYTQEADEQLRHKFSVRRLFTPRSDANSSRTPGSREPPTPSSSRIQTIDSPLALISSRAGQPVSRVSNDLAASSAAAARELTRSSTVGGGTTRNATELGRSRSERVSPRKARPTTGGAPALSRAPSALTTPRTSGSGATTALTISSELRAFPRLDIADGQGTAASTLSRIRRTSVSAEDAEPQSATRFRDAAGVGTTREGRVERRRTINEVFKR